MHRLNDAELEFYDFWIRMLVSTSAIVLMLSLAGIYAVMSFTVARRTREIGVRVALGADSRGVVLAVFRKPLIQVVSGVIGGVVLLAGISFMASGGLPKLSHMIGIGADAVIMLVLCSLACVVPTRRALAVQPTEALRQE
jgi:putative ABC transport system permease protein